jgi:hypothetical protein
MASLNRPALQWQGDPNDDDPYGWFDCTCFSAAMGGDAVSGGAIVPTGGDIRRLSNETTLDPKDPGLNLDQVRAACARFGFDYLDRQGKEWASVVADLRQRRWVVGQVWYPKMGDYRVQKPGNFGHAIGLMGISTTKTNTLVFDPLAHDARWVPLSVVREAMEEWGRRTGMPGKVRFLSTLSIIPTEV